MFVEKHDINITEIYGVSWYEITLAYTLDI